MYHWSRCLWTYSSFFLFIHSHKQFYIYMYVCVHLSRVDSILKNTRVIESYIHTRFQRKGRRDTSFIPWHEQMKIPPRKKRISRYGESSLVGYLAKEACNKKSHTSRPRRCRGGINGGTYTIVSRLNRGTRKKKKRGEGLHGTWREKFFNFLSESRWSWVEIKKGQVIRRGMGSLYYSTPITTTTLRFSCYLFPRVSRPRPSSRKPPKMGKERRVPKGEVRERT